VHTHIKGTCREQYMLNMVLCFEKILKILESRQCMVGITKSTSGASTHGGRWPIPSGARQCDLVTLPLAGKQPRCTCKEDSLISLTSVHIIRYQKQ
jgi:hypothetical protein